MTPPELTLTMEDITMHKIEEVVRGLNEAQTERNECTLPRTYFSFLCEVAGDDVFISVFYNRASKVFHVKLETFLALAGYKGFISYLAEPTKVYRPLAFTPLSEFRKRVTMGVV